MRRKYANFDEFEPNRKITTEEDGEFLTCLKQALFLSLKEMGLLNDTQYQLCVDLLDRKQGQECGR